MLRARSIASPVSADAQAGQPEAGRGDAAHVPVRFVVGRAVGAAAVADEAGPRVGFVPEEAERPPRQVLEERLVVGGEGGPRGRSRRRRSGGSRPGMGAPAESDEREDGRAGDPPHSASTSNEASRPPSELVPTRTSKRPGSTTHLISRS